MQVLDVWGTQGLHGTVRVPGAKNSVLPLLAASLLCTQTVTLENVPGLTDVACAVRILRELGCGVRGPRKGVIDVLPASEPGSTVPPEDMRAMRSSLFFLAPMLSRTGRAVISLPGGCNLGARPIDMHLRGLAAMGAEFRENGQMMAVLAPRGLKGARITLRFPSVGATETLLMAAVCARGETVIYGAAVEPEVTDLALFLKKAGACISGIGTRCLRIMGTERLEGVAWAVCPDRITAATLLCAVAACGGRVTLQHVDARACAAVARVLRRAGCDVRCAGPAALRVEGDGRLMGVGGLFTDVYPAFPTDAAPLLAAALLRANGESAITDTVFENRFACAAGFTALGANAGVLGRTITIHGVRQLQGAYLTAPDLRGGAALAIAALAAEGESLLMGTEHIDRGYEDLASLLAALGADTARVRRRELPARQA